MPKYNFTEEQEKEIIEFYLEPNSLNETCKHFGFVNKQVVIRILKKYNIATHSPKLYRKIQVEKTIITNNKKYGCN